VLYDTTYSRRGALLPVARAPRVANPFDIGLSVVIKNPHALPMYREDRKRSREKVRNVSGELGLTNTRRCSTSIVSNSLAHALVCYRFSAP
jgi:hypothetical protein